MGAELLIHQSNTLCIERVFRKGKYNTVLACISYIDFDLRGRDLISVYGINMVYS